MSVCVFHVSRVVSATYAVIHDDRAARVPFATYKAVCAARSFHAVRAARAVCTTCPVDDDVCTI
eukprot:9957019-Lingulodinium_polyedra.AAC.1